MALDKLTLLDETIINNTATSVATTVVNNSAQTNYISFPVATASPTSNGWRVYKDTDTIAPTIGTGGSPNTTLTQNTSSPLNSTGDFRVTKTSSASRRGEGISTDFTIASRHLAKVLQISFDYELISGTLATDDIRVYIIQDPSGTPVVIEPVNVSIQGSLVSSPTIKLRHLATFQTHISVTSYRLCIHVASTSTSAYTVDFNNFKVWEPNQSIGSIITDWVSYTPTFTGFATTSLVNLKWRRVGSNLEVEGDFYSGSADAGGTQHRIYFPSGLVAQANISRSGYRYLAGRLERDAVGNSNIGVMADSNRNYFTFGSFESANPYAELTTSSFGVSAYQFRIKASVPIAGWGSSVAMSSDSGDGRVVACKYTGMTNVSVTASTIPFKWTTRAIDTHNSYDPSTGRFTAPINGIYRVSLTCSFDLTAGSIYIFKNGNIDTYIIQISSSTYVQGGSAIISLNAGDYIDVRQTNGTYTSYANSYVHISIDRISAGSQVIATQETVACEVWTNTNTPGSATTNFIFNQVNRDSHGAWNTTTGIYTAPMSGWYNLNMYYAPTTSANNNVHIYKAPVGGSFSIHKIIISNASVGINNTVTGGVFYLLSGEQISVRPSTSISLYGTTTLAGNSSWLTINRIGI